MQGVQQGGGGEWQPHGSHLGGRRRCTWRQQDRRLHLDVAGCRPRRLPSGTPACPFQCRSRARPGGLAPANRGALGTGHPINTHCTPTRLPRHRGSFELTRPACPPASARSGNHASKRTSVADPQQEARSAAHPRRSPGCTWCCPRLWGTREVRRSSAPAPAPAARPGPFDLSLPEDNLPGNSGLKQGSTACRVMTTGAGLQT